VATLDGTRVVLPMGARVRVFGCCVRVALIGPGVVAAGRPLLCYRWWRALVDVCGDIEVRDDPVSQIAGRTGTQRRLGDHGTGREQDVVAGSVDLLQHRGCGRPVRLVDQPRIEFVGEYCSPL